jgi:hypothetical protein
MVYSSGECSECKRFHEPDRDHKNDCPQQPRVFWSRESRQLYLERQELEVRHAIEARERREAAEAHALTWAKASGVLGEFLEEARQARFKAAREACAAGRAAYHEYREAQEAARQILRNQRVRERGGQ